MPHVNLSIVFNKFDLSLLSVEKVLCKIKDAFENFKNFLERFGEKDWYAIWKAM